MFLVVETLAGVAGAVAVFRAFSLFGLAVGQRVTSQPKALVETPLVTVAIPAKDEERVIESTIRAVAASAYPRFEVLVIDDGSTDGTAALAGRLAKEFPVVRVLSHQPNRGKAKALDRALAEARGEVFLTVDADTRLDPQAIARFAAPFADKRVAAVAGNVKVGNRERWLAKLQSIEYVGALNLDRRAQAALHCITTVPGAAGAWRTSVLRQVGGFPSDTVTEDTDLTLRVLTLGYDLVYADHAVAWTQAPVDLASLFRQRLRWLHGNLQCLWKHRGAMIAGPWVLRLFGLPNFAWTHLISFLLLPLIFVVGPQLSWAMGPSQLLGAILGFYSVDLLLLAIAHAMDREDPRLLVHLPAQRVLFPVFLAVVFVVVLGRLVIRQAPTWGRADRVFPG